MINFENTNEEEDNKKTYIQSQTLLIILVIFQHISFQI